MRIIQQLGSYQNALIFCVVCLVGCINLVWSQNGHNISKSYIINLKTKHSVYGRESLLNATKPAEQICHSLFPAVITITCRFDPHLWRVNLPDEFFDRSVRPLTRWSSYRLHSLCHPFA
jgi:hypothetical protein